MFCALRSTKKQFQNFPLKFIYFYLEIPWGELIRTITAPAGKKIPVEMELAKKEAAKAQGGKLCLYMIADNGTLSSEASSTACLAI